VSWKSRRLSPIWHSVVRVFDYTADVGDSRRTLGRWSNNRFDAERRDIWLRHESDGTWTVEIGVGRLDQPQRAAVWSYPDEAAARAWVERCIAAGGDGWTEIPPSTTPGGATGWYLGTTD
jgi:hypothetical protein